LYQAGGGQRAKLVTGVRTCALPIPRGTVRLAGSGVTTTSPGCMSTAKLYSALAAWARWRRLYSGQVSATLPVTASRERPEISPEIGRASCRESGDGSSALAAVWLAR